MHPSDEFATAFGRAQHTISLRAWRNDLWPITEFWEDKTRKDMKVIDGYINPILKDALAKKRAVHQLALEETDTLLDHLVEHTDGE